MTSRPSLNMATLTLGYFESRVDVVDGCWIWRGSKDWAGYARMGFEGKSQKVSRIIFAFLHGPIPAGMYVCHNCPAGDNPSCINPAHLFLGTAKDNSRDMAAKGRQVMQAHPEKRTYGARNGTHTQPHSRIRGERQWYHKLTEPQVIEILQLAAQGASLHELARRFEVSRRTIQHIVHRESWKHVNV